MTRSILHHLESHEFLTTTSHLATLGYSQRSIGRAVSQGQLLRVCRGWVATRDARQDAVLAVLHRGKLAGPSALATRGVWDALATRVHVQRAPNAHPTSVATTVRLEQFRAREFMPAGVLTRWTTERYPDSREAPWRQSVIDALLYVAKFAPYEQFIACVDSALVTRTLPASGLRALTALLPSRLHNYLADICPRSEAGIETLPRLRLSPLVRSIEPQASVPGLGQSGGDGRIDLLIDGWLAFEADGDGWHDPAADRLRDQQLILRGYYPVHFGLRQIVDGWPQVEATVLELLRYPPLDVGRGIRARRS